jgi:hypothetical protein
VYVYNPGFGDYNGLEINLKNNVGNLIHIDYIEIVQFNNKHSDQFIPNLANGEKTKSPNNLQVYDLRNGLPLMKSGEKYSFDFTLTYTNTESKLQHTVNGQVSGKVN